MQYANSPLPQIDNHTLNATAVDVVIEIPRGSFLKRGSQGQIDFISPLPLQLRLRTGLHWD